MDKTKRLVEYECECGLSFYLDEDNEERAEKMACPVCYEYGTIEQVGSVLFFNTKRE